MERYNWMLQWVGPAGYDWVVCAWAVVCSTAIGIWFMGSEGDELRGDVSENGTMPWPNSRNVLIASFCLAVLTIPSFILDDLPLPVISTPFSVGCILPAFQRYKHHDPTLDDFITESKKLTSSANILLWPEGAVQFRNESERDAALDRVRSEVTGSHVGVSFEELVSDPSDTSGHTPLKRTGVALVSRSSSEVHLLYYKRHLVPSKLQSFVSLMFT
jgi:hypothetical protein